MFHERLMCNARAKAPLVRHAIVDYALPMAVYGALYFSVLCAMGIGIALLFGK